METRKPNGQFPKGHKLGGRPPGRSNKTTESLRKAVLQVFDNIGGVAAFTSWAREEPTEFYRIAAKLIPREIGVTVNDVRPVIIDLASPAEIEASHEEHEIH